jgi:hypothetical protein
MESQMKIDRDTFQLLNVDLKYDKSYSDELSTKLDIVRDIMPTMRLGQLVYFLMTNYTPHQDVFYVTDRELCYACDKVIEENDRLWENLR